jgi:hypothetical protein
MKTNTQHTPGPWSYQLGQTVFEVSTIDRNICEINTPGSVDDEDEANARLIASAPELLASEMQFVQLCNNLAVALTEDQITEAIRELTSHCHAARAAIAKATGGQP